MRYKRPKDYDKKIVLRKNKAIGYIYFLDKDHPLSSQKTFVIYYHRHIASLMIGRWLLSREHVHHKNHDRSDNRPVNLEVLSRLSHGKRHRKHPDRNCFTCGILIRWCQKTCSRKCYNSYREKFKITRTKLKSLIWKYSMEEIGNMLCVSGKCIRKRCDKLKINRPPAGYWLRGKRNEL